MNGVLDKRALNRATLERQLLLRRSTADPLEALQHLVGLQAQTPQTWYVGLWSRLHQFDPEVISDLLEQRRVVRMALMRSTIHLVAAEDCLWLRPLVQPVIERSVEGTYGRALAGVHRAELAKSGQKLVEAEPMIFSALGRRLAEQWPNVEPAALAQAVRAAVPLVQMPPRGKWKRSGPAVHTSVQSWLGRSVAQGASLRDLVTRYFAAFGPASVADISTWSGIRGLKEVVAEMRPALVSFRSESGVELFDLPDAPRPSGDDPAPVRYLYDYDNLLLSHDDRSRVVTEEFRSRTRPPNGVVPGTVLIDGFTNATWKVHISKTKVELEVRPLIALTPTQRAEVLAEGEALLSFVEPDRHGDVSLLTLQ